MKRQTWQRTVRENYETLEELRAYDSIYKVAKRCGFPSAKALWDANPVIGGSSNPSDFGLAEKESN